MQQGRIRPIVIGAFCKNGKILVLEGYDSSKQQFFYRPLGGGIEFGESSQEALIREMHEEIGAAVTNLRYLGVIENIFTFEGGNGHEIVFIYAGEFANPTIYTNDILEAHEDDGQTFKALWKNLADFRAGQPPLYPTGLLELLV